jgi:cation diffusion facilitator family transporter
MGREARRSDSMALMAEATHLRTNVVQAGAIIAGLLLVWATDEPVFDPIAALLLAAYMAWTAIGLVRTALRDIMDASLPPADVDVIKAVLKEHESDVRGLHNLRTRRSGGTRQVDMHLLFESTWTVAQVHAAADRISDEIRRRLPGSVVVIHPEPDSIA